MRLEAWVDNPLPNFAEERDYPVIGDLCTRVFLVQRTVMLSNNNNNIFISHDHDAADSTLYPPNSPLTPHLLHPYM